MTVKMCDRCSKIIPPSADISQTKFPKVEVQVTRQVGYYATIDLCNACVKEFLEWIVKGEKNNGEEAEPHAGED